MGKGDKRRPSFVDRETLDANWARTFHGAEPRPVDTERESDAKELQERPAPRPFCVVRGGRST